MNFKDAMTTLLVPAATIYSTHQTDVGVEAHLEVAPAELDAARADPQRQHARQDELRGGPADAGHQHLTKTRARSPPVSDSAMSSAGSAQSTYTTHITDRESGI